MRGLHSLIILALFFMLNHVSVSADESGAGVRLDVAVIKKLEENIENLEEKVEQQAQINRKQNNRIGLLHGKIDSLESQLVNLKSR